MARRCFTGHVIKRHNKHDTKPELVLRADGGTATISEVLLNVIEMDTPGAVLFQPSGGAIASSNYDGFRITKPGKIPVLRDLDEDLYVRVLSGSATIGVTTS